MKQITEKNNLSDMIEVILCTVIIINISNLSKFKSAKDVYHGFQTRNTTLTMAMI